MDHNDPHQRVAVALPPRSALPAECAPAEAALMKAAWVTSEFVRGPKESDTSDPERTERGCFSIHRGSTQARGGLAYAAPRLS
jgi:hypothetical protein